MSSDTNTTSLGPQPLLHSLQAAILADWHTRLIGLAGNYARGLTPRTELDAEMNALLQGLANELALNDPGAELSPQHPLTHLLRTTSESHSARGFTAGESLRYLQTCKEAIAAVLHDPPGQHQALLEQADRLLDRCVEILFSSLVAARENVIRRQGESLREVSTPVITLWDSMLLLPLIGIVDSVRAQQISETLLEAICRSEAEVTLIDVTGVPVMDTSVARHILKTVAAAEMLGTRVILTGIAPVTAQTMVKLGIDMTGVPTRASLKSGLALALTLTGRSIVVQGSGGGP